VVASASGRANDRSRASAFQSPSLRGSGRFTGAASSTGRRRRRFQSPSLRGSGRFLRPTVCTAVRPYPGFNPLHCGAVVASYGDRKGARMLFGRFNPLHCGAVVASGEPPRRAGDPATCFNPLHCGAVVASERARQEAQARRAGFNPLHCGAVVASLRGRAPEPGMGRVSIPFIAGQWSLPAYLDEPSGWRLMFQSPSLRGSGRFF